MDNILNARIVLRYATYERWMNSSAILYKGEVAVAEFSNYSTIYNMSNSTPANTPPAIGIKIGNGRDTFANLPWVQAIAADVYNWAKSSVKPTYSASEITGLATYIENHSSSSGGSTAYRQYQIIQGTNDYANKYFLQYKNDDSDTWIVDTNHYIDVTNFQRVYEWIGETSLAMGSINRRIGSQLYDMAVSFACDDTAVENQFVTSVSQTLGAISVTRARPSFTNLTGHATVEQGGTGLTTLPVGEILVGNGTNAITSIALSTNLVNENVLVPSYVIKSYIDNATAGLTGAMHFIGETFVVIDGPVDPQIADYNFAQARKGDVILYQQKEYVWTGNNWRLLGDEGSYAIKGSITNADIAANADIALTKIANLPTILQSKVDKENGKILFSIEEQNKLATIATGAQVNVIEHIFYNNQEVPISQIDGRPAKSIDLNVKEFTDAAALHLSSIETGAQVNVIEAIYANGTLIEPVNKAVNIITMTTDEHTKLAGIETGAQVNILESIILNNETTATIVNKAAYINSITNDERLKLMAIEAEAQVNIIESITLDGTTVPIVDKTAIIQQDPHTAHINKIESIYINGVEQEPDEHKAIRLSIDPTALSGSTIAGAVVPNGNSTEPVTVNNEHNLVLARVAKTGHIEDLIQEDDTYIILNCGTSTTVI